MIFAVGIRTNVQKCKSSTFRLSKFNTLAMIAFVFRKLWRILFQKVAF